MRKERANPFYVLLVILGIVFSITACAYGVMTYRASPSREVAEGGMSPSGLMSLLGQHGEAILFGELGLLAVATFSAMALDGRRGRGAEKKLATEITEDSEGRRIK